MSYTTTATDESRIYDGIRDLNLSCPAVSHSCKRTVRSSKYMVFDRKSIPMVAYVQKQILFRSSVARKPAFLPYLIVLVKCIIHKPRDNGSLSYSLIPKKDQLILRERRDIRGRSCRRAIPIFRHCTLPQYE